MDVRMPDGTIVRNVPDGTSKDEVLKRYLGSLPTAGFKVRAAVAGSRTTQDKLSTLRRYYPDAVQMGDTFTFTDEKGQRRVFDKMGLDPGDVADILPEIGEAIGGIAGGIFGAVGGPTGIAVGTGIGAAGGKKVTELAIQKILGSDDTRSLFQRYLDDTKTAGYNAVFTRGATAVAEKALTNQFSKQLGVSVDEAAEVVKAISAPKPQPTSTIQPGEIRRQAAKRPENLVSEIVAPDRPSVAMQREIADAAQDLLSKGDVPLNPDLKLYEQVADLLSSGRITTDVLEETLKARNLTREGFAKGLYGETISQSARELQVLSQLSQQLKDLGVGIDPSRAVGDTRGVLYRIDDIRRGLLVSQLGTAVRNAMVGGKRSIFDTFGRAMEYGIQKVRGVNPENPVLTPAHVWGQLERLLSPKESFEITKKVLEIRPKAYDSLMRQYSADLVMRNGKSPLAVAEKGVHVLNFFNRFQDQYFRSAVFADSLERRMAAAGMDMKGVLANNQHGRIPKEIIDGSVDDALEFTFSDPMKTEAGRAFVNFIEKFRPLTTTAVPFPRFMANSMRFMSETSPFGPLWLLSKAEREALKAGNNRIPVRAMLGSAALYGAYALRDSEIAGERWYEVKTPGGNNLDLRAYYPIAGHLYAADLIKRMNDGTFFNVTAKDLFQGVSGAQVRGGTGLYMVDGLLNEVGGDGSGGAKAWNVAKRLLGEYMGGFFLPFQQLKDAYSQYDEEDQVIRDVAESPLIGPTLTKFPGMGKDLPAAVSPTQADPMQRTNPLLRQFGFTVVNDRNSAQKEIDRLQIKRNEFFRNTGVPEADRAIASKMGPMVEEVVSAFVETPFYKSLDPNVQRLALKDMIGEVRSYATEMAQAENPELFAKVKFNRMPKDERRILNRVYGITADSLNPAP